MANTKTLRVYNVVEVWRGMAVGVASFPSLSGAQRQVSRLQARLNLLEDDVKLFVSSIRLTSDTRWAGRRVRGAEMP